MSPAAPAPTPVAPSRMRWVRSLRVRLLLATLAGLAVAMVLAGLVLSGLFREHVQRQFELALTQQLDQLTTRLDFDAAGHPVIDTQALSDPRWQKPYSGLYWQIDQMAPDGHGRAGVLRSRSLWDTSLPCRPTRWPMGLYMCTRCLARRVRPCWRWSARCAQPTKMQRAGG